MRPTKSECRLERKRSKEGILLDIGCGNRKNERFVGMDKQDLPGVDIVHDLEVFPWPIKDESVLTIVANNIIEHIKPWLTVELFNECWRVLVPGGQMVIATPYAGSIWYWSDPTHCNGFTEKTFLYFDPDYPMFFEFYHSKPWKIEPGFPVYQLNGMLEVIMNKRPEPQKEEPK